MNLKSSRELKILLKTHIPNMLLLNLREEEWNLAYSVEKCPKIILSSAGQRNLLKKKFKRVLILIIKPPEK
jgi:hypothetical protein